MDVVSGATVIPRRSRMQKDATPYPCTPWGASQETGRYVASIFDGRRKLKIKRSASDARTAGINDITSPRYDYPSIFLVALLDYQRKLDLYSLILSGLRATRREPSRRPLCSTSVRIADNTPGAALKALQNGCAPQGS